MSSTNLLVHETSPYLLQHAHNPVNWHAWNEQTLAKAISENKPLLVSIGYSTCHWCHVMEKESFENEEVAELMNNYFICIKIDREERPELDAFYMDSIHVLGLQGGWPLNVFALPNGKPIWGGTYFPKTKWMGILERINNLFVNNHEKLLTQAEEITYTIQQMYSYDLKPSDELLQKKPLLDGLQKWKAQFDLENGGTQKEQNKFPLPTNYSFLLQYLDQENDPEIDAFTQLTLDKISYGGIFDHLEGGFCRYSTDKYWKVPHFEKMLYDNAQLISVYCKAYERYKNPWYKEVVEKTIHFCMKQLYNSEGYFYSALDADTEGVEGKYYVWTEAELKTLLTEQEYTLFGGYYNIEPDKIWEHDYYVLHREKSLEEVAQLNQLELITTEKILQTASEKLLQHKLQTRVYPGLDDKCISSWNSLMIKALCHAYVILQKEEYKQIAEKCLQFTLEKLLGKEQDVYHIYTKGQVQKNAFLEDHTFYIEALLASYEISANETLLHEAKAICDKAIEQFYDEKTGFFYLSGKQSDVLVRKQEVYDQVIPSANASMANNLFLLGKYFRDDSYHNMSYRMVTAMHHKWAEYLAGYTLWAELFLKFHYPYYELIVTGNKIDFTALKMLNGSLLIAYKTTANSTLPLLEKTAASEQTLYYVCDHKQCYAPTENVEDVKKIMGL